MHEEDEGDVEEGYAEKYREVHEEGKCKVEEGEEDKKVHDEV